MLISEEYREIHCKKGKIRGIKRPAMNQCVPILLHITCIQCNIEMVITQYYTILHITSFSAMKLVVLFRLGIESNFRIQFAQDLEHEIKMMFVQELAVPKI